MKTLIEEDPKSPGLAAYLGLVTLGLSGLAIGSYVLGGQLLVRSSGPGVIFFIGDIFYG
jgi:hypothetical protein